MKWFNGCPHCMNNHDPGITCRELAATAAALAVMEAQINAYRASIARIDAMLAEVGILKGEK